jgi:SAM-dependent methyltransferase
MTNAETFMTFVKRVLPRPVKYLALVPRRLLFYSTYDSTSYWRGRAKEPGQAAVLWPNQEYNQLYRAMQAEILAPHLRGLNDGARVLDIGCGIGVVAKLMLALNPTIKIDAVDFEEMLEAGRENLQDPRITRIACSAEDYRRNGQTYDLIVSCSCYSAIRDIAKLEKALANGADMLKVGGTMLLIDPFHRWNYLARAKYGSHDVERFLRSKNLQLVEKSGVLFWPFREWLADSKLTGEKLIRWFRMGERIRERLGAHLWADHKILIFKKLA